MSVWDFLQGLALVIGVIHSVSHVVRGHFLRAPFIAWFWMYLVVGLISWHVGKTSEPSGSWWDNAFHGLFAIPPIMTWTMWILFLAVLLFRKIGLKWPAMLYGVVALILAFLGAQWTAPSLPDRSERAPITQADKEAEKPCDDLETETLENREKHLELKYSTEAQSASDSAVADAAEGSAEDTWRLGKDTIVAKQCKTTTPKPDIVLTVKPAEGNTVTLDVSKSKGEGLELWYHTTDGKHGSATVTNALTTPYTFSRPGTYTVKATITDFLGNESSTEETVTVPGSAVTGASTDEETPQCAGTWAMLPRDHSSYSWVPGGVQELAGNTNPLDGAATWLERISSDSAALAALAYLAYGNQVSPTELVDENGCANAYAVELFAALEQKIHTALAVTPDDPPATGYNTGIHDGLPTINAKPGLTGNRAGITIKFDKDRGFGILARNGNPVLTKLSHFDIGPTDDVPGAGASASASAGPTASSGRSGQGSDTGPSATGSAGASAPPTTADPTPTGGLDHNGGLLNPPTGAPPVVPDPPQEVAPTTSAPSPTDCEGVEPGHGPPPGPCPVG